MKPSIVNINIIAFNKLAIIFLIMHITLNTILLLFTQNIKIFISKFPHPLPKNCLRIFRIPSPRCFHGFAASWVGDVIAFFPLNTVLNICNQCTFYYHTFAFFYFYIYFLIYNLLLCYLRYNVST